MKKRQQGILTVEASIVLTLCLMFILFIFSFARVYSAQSMVSHAVLQASDAVALESYLRESTLNGSEADVVELANRLKQTDSISAQSFTSLRSADIPKIAKEKFVLAIAENETKADAKLKQLGVVDGIDGIDFSASKMDLGKDDVIVSAKYSVKTQFSVLGYNEIDFIKSARSKTFGDILFDIVTIPENSIMGSASGGGNYKYGTEIQISATPHYGYKFKKWADGNTANPRTVTVTGAKTYVAVFVEDQFGINTNVNPSDGGTVSGGGTYNYLSTQTVTANPGAGYHFTKWSIYKHKDRTTAVVNGSASHTITVDQSYTCTAYFEPNTYTISTKCEGGPSNNYAHVVYQGSTKQSTSVPYKSSFKITASSVSGYKFLGWKIEGSSNFFSTSSSVNLTAPPNNVTYIACYESTLRTVTFYNYDGSVYTTRQVYAGSSLGGSMPANPSYAGYRFNGWSGFNSGTKVYNNMAVRGSWSACQWHDYYYRCSQQHSINYFNGSGGCGYFHWHNSSYKQYNKDHIPFMYHSSKPTAYCRVCRYCYKVDTEYIWCGYHATGRAVHDPANGHRY